MMFVSRRTALLASLATLAVSAAPAARGQTGRADPKRLRIGTSNTFGFAATFKANGDDTFNGFSFEIVPFNGGSPQIISALNAGELDIGELGEVGPVVAQSADIPFKIIAATEPWGEGQGILVDNKSTIANLADLKGKKISYTRSTNSHWVLLKTLEKAGLKPDQVQHIFLPPGTNVQAVLETGGIDAAIAIDTLLTAFERSGSRRLASGAEVGAENPLYYIASDAAITNKNAAIAAFVAALAKHVAWGHAKPEERAKAVAELLRIDPEIALIAERKRPARLALIGDRLRANNQKISDVFFEQGLIGKRLDASLSFTDQFNGSIAP
ncbi:MULTISPECIES: ABC transporter substrate-binding protein [unclassified Beijerinckia]|uniref:ABC transporter substrate-binding protein n=1 Tax=unclassified Beijerinckia TaxID=2638183 RepID=UPI0008959472|nr:MULTISPECIES: ABC transporter substrate-binding protein [unclassified Beijerinckia]MDH7798722.1 sulfonate transport system substrate-binding protein [Beijerinckia sp. GAS462]SED30843.1 sulfonate transport system substrate-binding protein [Beijerinckia sp. 28-YEA-48]